MKKYVLCSLLILNISCNKRIPNTFQVLNAEKAIENSTSFDIENYFNSIEYIPLETNEKCLIGELNKVVKTKDYIFVSDLSMNLFQFDTNGKFISKIGKKGGAPGEYTYLIDYVVDEINEYIYLNVYGKIQCYSIEGEFIKTTPLGEINNQVMALDNKNRLFFILPDIAQPKDKKFVDLIRITSLDGTHVKTFTSDKVRHAGISYFNSIYFKNENLYYKEEFGSVIYRINSDLKKDSIYSLDLGNLAFKPKDFDFSLGEKWKQLYRLKSLLFFEDITFFKIQNGLMDSKFSTLIWDNQNLISPHSTKSSLNKGIYLNNLEITPISDYNNELISKVSIEDIIINKDEFSNSILIKMAEKITENSNPVLVILKTK
jgi:6-bladed beta-propeller